MKALNVPQPWATLLTLKIRCYHTVSWETQYRGPIAIYASDYVSAKTRLLFYQNPLVAVFLTAGFKEPEDLPRGAIIGTGVLWDCRKIETGYKASSMDLLGVKVGHYVWCFEDVEALPEPVRQDGGEGLWEVEGDQQLSVPI